MISGVPQGTVLGTLLFLIMIADIDKYVSDCNLISFADDTRLYSGVADVTDCDNLQFDVDTVYDWASSNNMFFNLIFFSYVSFSSNGTASKSNVCQLGILKYNNFRWRSIRMFNRLPKCICMLSSCSVNRFKSEQHDSYLRNIVDLPCQPRFNNSLDGGDCLHV